MPAAKATSERIPIYCALCVSRCGAIATIEDGRFVRLDPDPSHPTGQALCAKGRAGPELVYHPGRLEFPLLRTRPKGDPEPGWKRIGWDEALSITASRLRQLATESGPESVAFSLVSPSTSASDDSMAWVERLTRTFGSPNLVVAMELCGWGRHFATTFTFGAPVPGRYLPDLEHAGCILFWGYNPNHARLAHATATIAAQKRGARLVVVDPRRTEPARRADAWLRVRPGTDGALALGIAGVMIERGWFDEPFVREWTNGPLLVRSDTGRLLTGADLEGGDPGSFVAWDRTSDRPVLYDPRCVRYETGAVDLALFGEHTLETPKGSVHCQTAFELAAARCRAYSPERVEAITGVPRGEVERAARLLWEARPLAYYAWSGVEMQTSSTQIARAIAQLSVLTGSFDARGGNVLFPSVPSPAVGTEVPPRPEHSAVGLGVADRPLGPARWGFATTDELYRAILERRPYAVRGLVGFGSNLLLSHGDVPRGREALRALDFYVHADLFMNPTAELADLVLPVASGFEREALKLGFEVSPEAQSLVQLRRPVAAPPGEARSDTELVFGLAVALGLGEHFWNGDVDAAYRHQLGPSGLSLEWLREHPAGARVALETRYRKFAEEAGGIPRGFDTPTRKIELYSETLLAHGHPPLPEYQEPLVGPVSRPDLAERYPLVLTCTKHTLFCETQHRALPSLRRKAMDPEVELHPAAAAERGIATGDWVRIETPDGSVRARARLNDTLQPDVVSGQHGWWQPCPEVGAPGYDPFGPDGANFNLLIGNAAIDPISGSVPHRAYLCEIRRIQEVVAAASRRA
ncbi:molybdopterin oxidoreductase [Anaeromyxobacter dehalogenans 2CP-1]|uniref:Molybdopterin oxidoreductase n=1 Tax=Anaeromyxobacter dehalogenans (strain ATCC BAA-258 / DSM 21875 / 2CP-1) TaxID=455488 RepID=B8J5P2_ANAD2|nr:molybdopterin-dependent oxidoreductase [Anaeromyxobacter dehalogenans]ACL64989.1 molybdopterin oxidoreductase [Anaeromyxobacter dehalogenans 2CP-1]